MPLIFDDTNQRLASIQKYAQMWINDFRERDNQHIVMLLETFNASIEAFVDDKNDIDLKTRFGYREHYENLQQRYDSDDSVSNIAGVVSSPSAMQIMLLIEDDWDTISRLCIQRLHTHVDARGVPERKHIVKSGDMFNIIANKYDIASDDLKKLNPHIKNVSKIYPDDVIYLSESQPVNVDGDITVLLEEADKIALNYYYAFDGIRFPVAPLVVFEKSFHVTHYKLTPYPIIAIPFRFHQRDMQPQTIAHEIAHYIFSHSNNPSEDISIPDMLQLILPDIMNQWQKSELTSEEKIRYTFMLLLEDEAVLKRYFPNRHDSAQVEDAQKQRITSIVSEWIEEIIADIFGVLLAGPSYIDTSINLMIKTCRGRGQRFLDDKRLRLNNREHPSSYIRPLIACQTLKWVSNYVRQDKFAEAFDDDPEYADRLFSFAQYRSWAIESLLYAEMLESSIVPAKDQYEEESVAQKTITRQSLDYSEADITLDDNTFIADEDILLTLSAVEHLVKTLLDGYQQETEEGTKNVNTWHKHDEDTIAEPYGIGTLIRNDAYLELIKTLQPNSSENRAAYPAQVDFSDPEPGFYTAGINKFEVNEPDLDNLPSLDDWNEDIQDLIQQAHDLRDANIIAYPDMTVTDWLVTLIYPDHDHSSGELRAFLLNTEYYLGLYNVAVHASSTAYKRFRNWRRGGLWTLAIAPINYRWTKFVLDRPV